LASGRQVTVGELILVMRPSKTIFGDIGLGQVVCGLGLKGWSLAIPVNENCRQKSSRGLIMRQDFVRPSNGKLQQAHNVLVHFDSNI